MTCAKVVVVCWITTTINETYHGSNHCEMPQKECPRSSGEDYTKCKAICHQAAHAEIAALNAARKAKTDLRGASAELKGLHYGCKPCATALRDAGIKTLKIHMGK